MAKKSTPPDRIRGFSSLTDYEAGVAEGRVATTELDGYTLRRIWHKGEWCHSVVDIVGALAEPKNVRRYWSDLKRQVKAEGGDQSYEKIVQLKLPAADGKSYATDCAPTDALFRIIQSVPSKRAEPIKQYLAKVGAERLEETAQPSRIVDRAIQTYRDQGRDDEWIDGRLQNISGRNELTDEWKARGAEGVKAAPITAKMHKEMLGLTPEEHKRLKKLGTGGHELRDQFDGLELAITTLGEQAARRIIVERDTKNFHDTQAASLDGAKIAGNAATELEKAIGRPIANSSNFLTPAQRAIAQAEEEALRTEVEAKAAARLVKPKKGKKKS